MDTSRPRLLDGLLRWCRHAPEMRHADVGPPAASPVGMNTRTRLVELSNLLARCPRNEASPAGTGVQ
jgi:hypothetical protein